jgi:type I restriction enzyme S subunit
MIADLRPYTKYKASSQMWLGEIPGHWSLLPNRALFAEVKDRNHPDEEMLSVTITRGIVKQKALLEGSSKKDSSNLDKSAYKLVQSRDIAYNKMRAWQGAIGASPLRGIISPAYVVMRLRNHDDIPSYYHHLFRAPQFAKEAERWSYGITSDMWSLRPEHFKMIYAPEPPPGEQAAIVRFLDWANGRLERAIRAKRKVIALLNEQKQAIIQRAVTRGLDPSVPLKPSGIPWLTDIPQHWRIVRNMGLFGHRIEPGLAGLPVLQVSLRSGITAEELDQFGRPKRLIADPTKYKRIYQGDVAYNTMRMWQGAVGVSPSDGLVSPAYVVLHPRAGTCAKFYDHIFHTDIYKQQVNRQSTGIVSDRNRLYWDSFKQMPNVAMPLSEQEAIVEFLRSETSGLSKASFRLDREIELLREYRTRLVADVVTGKLDVREAATGLPDEALPDVVEDDTDLHDETEAVDEEAAK